MQCICYLGAEISSVLPRLVRKMLNLILARRLSYKLSVQIQSDCLFWCLSPIGQIPGVFSSDWSMMVTIPSGSDAAIVRSQVVTLHSVIVNRSHKNSFILIFILPFCFVFVSLYFILSSFLTIIHFMCLMLASLIHDTLCSKQRLTKTLPGSRPLRPTLCYHSTLALKSFLLPVPAQSPPHSRDLLVAAEMIGEV